MHCPYSLDYNWLGNSPNHKQPIWNAPDLKCMYRLDMTAAKFFEQQDERTSSDLDDVLCTISTPVVYIQNQIIHQCKRNQRFVRILTRLCLFWRNWCPVHSWPLGIAAVQLLFAFFSCAIPPTSMTTPRTFNAVVWNVCLSHDRYIIRICCVTWYHTSYISFCMLSYQYVQYQRLYVICNYLFMRERQSWFRWTLVEVWTWMNHCTKLYIFIYNNLSDVSLWWCNYTSM